MTPDNIKKILNSDAFAEMLPLFDAFERIDKSEKDWLISLACKLAGDDIDIPQPPGRIITLFNVH